MTDYFFDLSEDDRREAMEYVRSRTGRPVHLLEKDVWVVWALNALFESPLSSDLIFKGGTSLSKVYKVIDRFSEDLDLTYNIRKLLADLVDDGGNLPASRNQASKWTKAVRHMSIVHKAAFTESDMRGIGTILPQSRAANILPMPLPIAMSRNLSLSTNLFSS